MPTNIGQRCVSPLQWLRDFNRLLTLIGSPAHRKYICFTPFRVTFTIRNCGSSSLASYGQSIIIPHCQCCTPSVRTVFSSDLSGCNQRDALIQDIEMDKKVAINSLDRPAYQTYRNDAFFAEP
jgi:hypothetical protein